MKSTRWTGVVAVALLAPALCSAAEIGRNYHAVSRLRVEYDDNIYQTETNEQDSVKFIAEVDLSYDLTGEQAFLSLRYKPSFVYWDDRPEDDTDLHHSFDGTFKYDLNPRAALQVKNTFRLTEDPLETDRQTATIQDNDYIYNAADATLSYLLAEMTRLSLAGRYNLLRYDESEIGDVSDYDIYVGGLTLRHGLGPKTAILGDFRYQDVQYALDTRDYYSIFAGTGVEQIFSPSLLGSLRGGYQYSDYDAEERGSKDNPYADGSLTFLPTPRTRLSLVGSYSSDETTVQAYSSQERTRFGASLGYDFTAKVAGYLSGSYTEARYYGDTSPDGTNFPNAREDWITVSARGTYQLTMRHWLEASWSYVDVDSDVQNSYDRNRTSLGWVYSF